MRTDDPGYVRRRYATEAGLRARAAIHGSNARDARDVILDEVRASGAESVLEMGCGWGELAFRLASETGEPVTASDLSPRMVDAGPVVPAERRCDLVTEAPFASVEAIRTYVGSTEYGQTLLDRIAAALPVPFVVTKRIAVFVATKAG